MTDTEGEPADRAAGIEAEDAGEADRAAVDAVLDALLLNVVFDGWTTRALDDALDRAEAADALAPGDRERLFGRGIADALDHFADWADRAMVERAIAEGPDFDALRTRDRIGFLVMARLDALALHKDAVRRALTVFAMPRHASLAARVTWRTADAAWAAAGDTATDHNWYTKRALLAGVWSASIVYWLDDRSEDHEATRGFVERRIDTVLKIGRRASSIGRLGGLAEAPFRAAGRLRRAVGGRARRAGGAEA
ncbi:MAG: COQ9 family protein [Azospirillaceae bacterium]